ncbi:MAG: hypothetical protein AAF638_04865 [Pseudomonadota bacterium]
MDDDAGMVLPDEKLDPGEVILVGSDNVGKPPGRARIQTKFQVHETVVVDMRALAYRRDFPFSDDTAIESPDGQKPTDYYSIALIYGYFFESNYYKLATPKLMVVSRSDEVTDKSTIIGNENLEGLKYWRVNKLDRSVEISVSEGQIEKLVLEANLPGQRSPNSYAANMQMTHRSGRLSN